MATINNATPRRIDRGNLDQKTYKQLLGTIDDIFLLLSQQQAAINQANLAAGTALQNSSAAVVAGAAGAAGAAGPQGPAGPAGPQGPKGDPSGLNPNLEGGSAFSEFLTGQVISGGAAATVYLPSQKLDGGSA